MTENLFSLHWKISGGDSASSALLKFIISFDIYIFHKILIQNTILFSAFSTFLFYSASFFFHIVQENSKQHKKMKSDSQ